MYIYRYAFLFIKVRPFIVYISTCEKLIPNYCADRHLIVLAKRPLSSFLKRNFLKYLL